ncbi:BQ2448_673 [Microbotryum intermedium]|uniref:BQ2448_673 protein n=1 Tax=Microbotryum intermedium TaxID=269621 RepID=A0A238F328_9BASI|nr:BQ2448_673 [Microbotryum intermedium]
MISSFTSIRYANHWDQPPISQESYLSSALSLIDRTITSLDIPSRRVFLASFSQGASLALIIGSFDAHFHRWGDKDRYYRQTRVEKDVTGLQGRGGKVEFRLFPGMGHYVTAAEVETLGKMIREGIARP